MEDVLAIWGLENQRFKHHARRENEVFAVGDPTLFALRAHRPGLRRAREIEFELKWMESLADVGLSVPRPVRTENDFLVVELKGQLYSLVTWLPGRPLGTAQEPLTVTEPEIIFRNLGELFKTIHNLPTPLNLDRPDWTMPGLVGEKPLWGRFWMHPNLSDFEREMMVEFRDMSRVLLEKLNLPSQLIHADPLQENILVEGQKVSLIDFDDCAYGYPLFDLATLFVQRLSDKNFLDLRNAALDGYGGCNLDVLALLFAIRCATYVGWIQDKMGSTSGKEMSDRILVRAIKQVRSYLEGNSPITQ